MTTPNFVSAMKTSLLKCKLIYTTWHLFWMSSHRHLELNICNMELLELPFPLPHASDLFLFKSLHLNKHHLHLLSCSGWICVSYLMTPFASSPHLHIKSISQVYLCATQITKLSNPSYTDNGPCPRHCHFFPLVSGMGRKFHAYSWTKMDLL